MPRKDKYKPRKDGRYEAKVQIGYKEDGRPNRISLYALSSRELERKVEDLKYEIDHNTYANDRDITLSRYAELWLKTYKVGKSLNTQAMYKNIIEKHISDLEQYKLSEITPMHVQRLINNRLDQPRTCEQIKMTLNQIFQSAINDSLIYKNPCNGIELPKRPKSVKRALTDTEVGAIKTAAFSDKERAFVYIIYGCGLRRGEALALTKADINLAEGTITVNKAVAFNLNDAYNKSPKSDSGYRTVDMPDFLISYLRDYLAKVDMLLFPMKGGAQMSKSSYIKMWQLIVKKMNIAAGGNDHIKIIHNLTAHIFRHNYCTMLYYSDISIKKACDLMGHADAKMIMNVYAHLDEKKERTKEKINQTIAL